MLTRRLARAACAVAMVAALVAFTGCGGSDNKSSSNTGTTSAPGVATSGGGGSSGSSGGGASGGGDLATYKAGVTKEANDFKNAAQAASAKVASGTAITDKIAGLDELKAVFSKAADNFAALSPPANLKADNDELVTELREFGTSVNDVELAYKARDQAKAAAALTQLQSLQTKVGTTIARIQTKIGG